MKKLTDLAFPVARLIYDGDIVGYRVQNRGKFYDMSKEHLEWFLYDTYRTNELNKVSDLSQPMRHVELIDAGKKLVGKTDTEDYPHWTYDMLAESTKLLHKPRTDETLKRMYIDFNKKYFDNQLPRAVMVYWSGQMTKCAGIMRTRRVRWRSESVGLNTVETYYSIGLSKHYFKNRPESEVVDTLVHEMIHVKLPNEHHDAGFHAEMARLNRYFGLNITVHADERALVRHIIVCVKCGHRYEFSRKPKSIDNRCCGVRNCRGSLVDKTAELLEV